MQTVTVTVGRNVGDKPMSAHQWDGFQSDVRKAVESVTAELWIASRVKHSEWQGVPEEAFIAYGPVVTTADVTDVKRALTIRLETLASRYGQEAIGVSWGESELVHSWEDSIPEVDSEDEEVFSVVGSGFYDPIADRYVPSSQVAEWMVGGDG